MGAATRIVELLKAQRDFEAHALSECKRMSLSVTDQQVYAYATRLLNNLISKIENTERIES